MNKSNKSDEYTITLDSGETLDLGDIIDTTGDITINYNNDYNMGTTTTYWSGDSVTDVVYSGTSDGTFTIDASTADTINIGNYTLSGDLVIDNKIDPSKVERMCKQYPALKKVWENFNSVYEMCKQDYAGKVKAGEIDEYDDDIPF